MRLLFAFYFTLFGSISIKAQTFDLVVNGQSDAVIVIPVEPTVLEIQAAKVFQDYINRISGAYLPIESDSRYSVGKEVLIGNVNRSMRAIHTQIEDSYFIESKPERLTIKGNGPKAALYGVYSFLESLGCRKYASHATVVPQKSSLQIPIFRQSYIPDFSFRQTLYRDTNDLEYFDWHKLDVHGGENGEWGSWVHTFEHLLSPAVYGEEHPEYFSFYDGKRHAGMVPSWDGKSLQPESQLCLSNPEVLEEVCRNLAIDIEKNPKAKYWSVSQNDNVNFCRCDKCVELDEKYASFEPGTLLYGTHVDSRYSPIGMGSLLTFINKVAERFPAKIISTLAYQYTRVPPKGLTPRENVNIMLCSIESTRNVPIEVGDPAFSSDLAGWGKLTDNIIIWDYVIQFPHLISPFPNLYTLQPNIQFFKKNNVSALFQQGNREIGGEFCELRAYLISKLMWDADANVDQLMHEFLSDFYGDASPFIKKYIHLLHDNNMAASGEKLSIFASPVLAKDTYLKPELMQQYDAFFDEAEKAVADDSELLFRVQTARMPLLYAKLEIAKAEKTGPRGAFDENGVKPEIMKALQDFTFNCLKNKVTRVSEWHSPPKVYAQNYLDFLQENQ